MNDREMLEYAAKAAGIEMPVWVDCVTDYDSAHFGSPAMQSGGAWSANTWNPRIDDGDAFRLAVKLEMDIFVRPTLLCTEVVAPMGNPVQEPHNNDPYAATRLAIVRAAAEIGKKMK